MARIVRPNGCIEFRDIPREESYLGKCQGKYFHRQ